MFWLLGYQMITQCFINREQQECYVPQILGLGNMTYLQYLKLLSPEEGLP